MPVHILPFNRDLTSDCAETVVADFSERLPNLSSLLILLPEALAPVKIQKVVLRAQLLKSAAQRGFEALIPPHITTPRQLFLERYAARDAALQQRRARLLLANALEQQPNLFPGIGKWQLADELIAFFDEISDYEHAQQSGGDFFKERAASLQAIWHQDTHMLVRFWQIWQTVFDPDDNPSGAWQQALISGTYAEQDEHIYLCGIHQLSPCLAVWAQRAYQDQRLTVIVHSQAGAFIPTLPDPIPPLIEKITGQSAPRASSDDDYSRTLDQVFATSEARFAEMPSQPLRARLCLFFPMNSEEHAWGIYAAVRQWLDEHYLKIGIVSPDRRLSRRIRAVFESYNIHLIDYSGWELSTTSSAAAVKNLLPDFNAPFSLDTVLALIRSPYCDYQIHAQTARYIASYLDQILARHDIRRTPLKKAIAALTAVGKKTPHPAIALGVQVATTLSAFELVCDGKTHDYADYFTRLFEAMDALGMTQKLAADDAGARLLSELRAMQQAAGLEAAAGSFSLWQSWIMHTLEQANYVPPVSDRGIFLMNPQQAQLMRFDALAILSLDDKHFPTSSQTHVVNEHIRRELNLENYEHAIGRQFQQLRALLENAKSLLLSCQQYTGSQKITPSPWLSALQNFQPDAGASLIDSELQSRAQSCALQSSKAAVGAEAHLQSRPAARAAALPWPQHFSVNAYQTIMNCPYQFFARYQLGLLKRDKALDYWQAKEYGTHLHRCLQALHADLPELPGPVQVPWVAASRKQILQLAARIVDKKFSEASRHNYANRFWQREAQAAISYYVDWAIARWQDGAAHTVETEVKLQKDLAAGLELHGIADLLVKSAQAELIVDYKSGGLPSNKQIDLGENVQLSSYVLLRDPIQEALYLGLKKEDRKQAKIRRIDNRQLNLYSHNMLQRLLAIKASYDANAPLAAWGDKKSVCQYCDYAGLCRRPSWDTY